ncbi:endonuclease III domain-containing protein [Ruegeria atlantica]|uniref:endonuclease III domain-containing protein n=1 Tax=Ruegeria atlantica TaxID=81569 RepID=UPI00148107F7
MQLLLMPDERTNRLITIHRRLFCCFGQPRLYFLLDPVSQLVMGLIGGKTRGEVSAAAFLRLRQRFVDWERLRDAPATEIRYLISDVTFCDVKARRLKEALQAITACQSALTLDFLGAFSVSSALYWLEQLPGVGRKTAATVLNFSTLRKPALVLDTHHLRVLKRLGLIGQCDSTVEAYDRLVPLLPHDWNAGDFDDHHQLVKMLGQRLCRPIRPVCSLCPIRDLCRNVPVRSG